MMKQEISLAHITDRNMKHHLRSDGMIIIELRYQLKPYQLFCTTQILICLHDIQLFRKLVNKSIIQKKYGASLLKSIK